MNLLNLGLAGYGIALAIHSLGDSLVISGFLIAFSLLVASILLIKFENNENATDHQLEVVLVAVLSLLGAVMSWL